jgi:hypothetical protein
MLFFSLQGEQLLRWMLKQKNKSGSSLVTPPQFVVLMFQTMEKWLHLLKMENYQQ